MFTRYLIHSTAVLTAGLLASVSTLSAQEIPEPVPSTPNPAGSVVPPAEADGVTPATDTTRPARNDTATDAERNRPSPVARQSTPMTAEDLQAWQQIASLHEQFVRSHVTGASESRDVSRTDPNRERLRRLWERLAEIERQLIVISADHASSSATTVTSRRTLRPLPHRDLDEIPDPLTPTNQAVRASENDRDQSTARALSQEDRSPPPNSDAAGEIIRESVPQQRVVRPVAGEPAASAVAIDEGSSADTASLWQEFIEVRRQILIAEIAAARQVDSK